MRKSALSSSPDFFQKGLELILWKWIAIRDVSLKLHPGT